MRRIPVAVSVLAFTLLLAAQLPPGIAAQSKGSGKASNAPVAAASTSPAIPSAIKDLPVRKVVLYKNGVGISSTPAR